MTLATRCPSCSTTFRVAPQQLQARRGTVRCGHCSTVFNALDNLDTLPDVEPSPLEPAPAAEPVPSAAKPVAEQLPELDVTHLDLDLTAPAEEIIYPEPPREVAAAVPVPAPGQAAEESFAMIGNPPDRRSNLAWGIGAGLLALVLVIQVVYLVREKIAAASPAMRPVLEAACGVLGCSVPLPRHPEKWSIDSSDLQAEPGRASVMTLSAVLRNRAAFVQAYPALELTLDDTAGRPVGRRVLTAEDYLPKGTNPGPGAAPNAEIVVRLTMDIGNLNAAGYRLFLFYPSASGEGSRVAASG